MRVLRIAGAGRASLIIIAVLCLALAAPVWAHTPANSYIGGYWSDLDDSPGNGGDGVADLYVHFDAASIPPATNKRDRVLEGLRKWEAYVPAKVELGYDSPLNASDDVHCFQLPQRFNAITMGEINVNGVPAGVLAATETCIGFSGGPSRIRNFLLKVDEDPPWYFGTSSPSSGQVDFLSIMTHESGHAHGYTLGDPEDAEGNTGGHFSELVDGTTGSNFCPRNSNRQTMCNGFPYLGLTYLRTLESHDVHTMVDYYTVNECPEPLPQLCNIH